MSRPWHVVFVFALIGLLERMQWGADYGYGAGRRSWTVWVSGLRQEEDISKVTGQRSKLPL